MGFEAQAGATDKLRSYYEVGYMKPSASRRVQFALAMVPSIAAAGSSADSRSADETAAGSAEYADAQAALVELGPAGFLEHIRAKSLADVDEWQTQMQLRPMSTARISLYSQGLPADARGLTGVRCIDDIYNAVAKSIAVSGDNAVAVIPEGPYVVPYVDAAAAGQAV